ncbi:MAG: Nif3-like dinuclear metal center hexameric protein [Synergistaceae bacterium]|nr:Nif3-like dinuclear metal center hexameric protein [Synergistaceae bacterium]MBR0168873.1 Nif3-like dinuclear metal center hexameric protein [Synergistaceae bacterium]MBR0279113.1 Nif3-like dinuclear metal center hexameric protein [Synergistaceae bacterium]
MKISGLLRHIDTFAPFSLAEDWDNSGLLIGNYDDEIKRIGVCLDAVSEAVIEAEELGCNVIVAHHPLIFRPVRNITVSNEQGRTIFEAVRRNINIIAVHTNWDKTAGGVNDILSALIGLKHPEPLNTFGVFGVISPRMKLNNFAEHVKSSWGLSRLDVYTKKNKPVSRVALCGGSGAEFWKSAKGIGADVYITADMKYHEISDAVNDGMTIALCDHGEMERVSISQLAHKLEGCGIETVIIDVKALPPIIRI